MDYKEQCRPDLGEASAVRIAEGNGWVAGFRGEDDREGAFSVWGRDLLGARGPQRSCPATISSDSHTAWAVVSPGVGMLGLN